MAQKVYNRQRKLGIEWAKFHRICVPSQYEMLGSPLFRFPDRCWLAGAKRMFESRKLEC